VTMAALRRGWPQHMPVPVVSSFAPECLRVARELAPEFPRGYLASRLPRRWQALLAEYGCATLHLDQRWLGSPQRAAVTAAGVPLVLYTVNDGERARQHLARGVTSVITDHLELVLGATNEAAPDASTAAVAG
jgi:glycerophosphoryl diester phosphodiesterase